VILLGVGLLLGILGEHHPLHQLMEGANYLTNLLRQ